LARVVSFTVLISFANLLAGEGYQKVAGTTVEIDPPLGFAASRNFAGFENTEIGASILVATIPAPYSKMVQGMTNEAIASKGMKVLETQTVSINQKQAKLWYVEQIRSGITFRKWWLLCGTDKVSFTVTGNFPKEHEDRIRSALKDAVLGTRYSE
jgi:hypothetical protein